MKMTVEDCARYVAEHPVARIPFSQKNIKFGYDPAKGFDATKEKHWNKDIDHARHAMENGVLPDNCSRKAVDRAIANTEKTGIEYRSDTRPDLGI